MKTRITQPDHPAMDELCAELAALGGELEQTGDWPERQLQLCGEYGVFEWFMPHEWDGQAWNERQIISGYLRLSAACLTTTFIITQRTGACRRLAASENRALKEELLPDLVRGDSFATVGISHLTTSRRHLGQPVLRAEIQADALLLDGFSPWVTGGPHADDILIGATLDDGRELLVMLPRAIKGVSTPPPAQLVGLTASHTGAVKLDQVRLPAHRLVAGPEENIMAGASGARTGGLQTSSLAIGLAAAAIELLEGEAERRDDLQPPADQLRAEWNTARDQLLALADGDAVCSSEELRRLANSLALRATQAALAAAKGTGYVVGHPAGRMCREALFFLVWSCPQPVLAANLCEFAGIGGGLDTGIE